jgi:hypothetical protein
VTPVRKGDRFTYRHVAGSTVEVIHLTATHATVRDIHTGQTKRRPIPLDRLTNPVCYRFDFGVAG